MLALTDFHQELWKYSVNLALKPLETNEAISVRLYPLLELELKVFPLKMCAKSILWSLSGILCELTR
jgi:hypothetical protein